MEKADPADGSGGGAPLEGGGVELAGLVVFAGDVAVGVGFGSIEDFGADPCSGGAFGGDGLGIRWGQGAGDEVWG